MKKFTEPLKNTVVEAEVVKDAFDKFFFHFKGLKKAEKPFFQYDGRNVDYSFIEGEAKKAGIKKIPSKSELLKLI